LGDAIEPLEARAQPFSLLDRAPGPLPHVGLDPGVIFGQCGELVGE